MISEYRRCQIAEWVCNGCAVFGALLLMVFVALGVAGR